MTAPDAAAQPMPTAAPAPSPEAVRWPAIDVARGLALLGVALVNVLVFADGWDSYHLFDRAAHAADVAAELVVGLLFTGRSYPLLAFLFGLGLAWQFRRQASTRVLRARLAALLLIGTLHALALWPGDIVAAYALIGLALSWGWPQPPRRLRRLLAAALLALVGIMLLALASSIAAADAPPLPRLPVPYALAEPAWAVWREIAALWPRVGLVQALLPPVWLAILAGIWAGSSPLLGNWLAAGAPRTPWVTAAMAAWLLANLADAAAAWAGGWDADAMGRGLAAGGSQLATTVAGLAAVPCWLWLAQRWVEGGPAASLRRLAEAAGRTPLTQFVGQSLAFFVLFSPLGAGWHGALGRAEMSAVAGVVWWLLAWAMQAWLERGHARGPLEGAWMALARRIERRLPTRAR
jgi:uncharacterized protein